MTCQVCHLSLPNQNVHAPLAGLRLLSIDLPEPVPLCGIQFGFLIMQDSMMDLTGQTYFLLRFLLYIFTWRYAKPALKTGTEILRIVKTYRVGDL